MFFILFFCQNFFVFSLALFILCFERIRIYQQLTTKELKEKREKSIGVYRPSWRNGWRAIQVSVLRLRRGQRCRRDTSTPTHDHCRRLVRVLDPEQLQHTERQTDASWNILFLFVVFWLTQMIGTHFQRFFASHQQSNFLCFAMFQKSKRVDSMSERQQQNGFEKKKKTKNQKKNLKKNIPNIASASLFPLFHVFIKSKQFSAPLNNKIINTIVNRDKNKNRQKKNEKKKKTSAMFKQNGAQTKQQASTQSFDSCHSCKHTQLWSCGGVSHTHTRPHHKRKNTRQHNSHFENDIFVLFAVLVLHFWQRDERFKMRTRVFYCLFLLLFSVTSCLLTNKQNK